MEKTSLDLKAAVALAISLSNMTGSTMYVAAYGSVYRCYSELEFDANNHLVDLCIVYPRGTDLGSENHIYWSVNGDEELETLGLSPSDF